MKTNPEDPGMTCSLPSADVSGLDNAYGVKVSSASWSAQVATIHAPAANKFQPNDFVAVEGVSPAGYDGTFKVLTVVNSTNSTQFTYALRTDPGTYRSGGFVIPPVANYAAGNSGDYCDYHIRLFGPLYDPAVGYFTVADTHMDWNDVSPCGSPDKDGDPAIGCQYPRFNGWQKDAARYIDGLFQGAGWSVTHDWVSLGNALVPEPGQATCQSRVAADGSSSGVSGHYLDWFQGSSDNSLHFECHQSNGYADLIQEPGS